MDRIGGRPAPSTRRPRMGTTTFSQVPGGTVVSTDHEGAALHLVCQVAAWLAEGFVPIDGYHEYR